MGVGADGVVKLAGAGEQDAEVGSEDGVDGVVEDVMSLERAGAHAKHEVIGVAGRGDGDGAVGTDADFAPAARELKNDGLNAGADGTAGRAAEHNYIALAVGDGNDGRSAGDRGGKSPGDGGRLGGLRGFGGRLQVNQQTISGGVP